MSVEHARKFLEQLRDKKEFREKLLNWRKKKREATQGEFETWLKSEYGLEFTRDEIEVARDSFFTMKGVNRDSIGNSKVVSMMCTCYFCGCGCGPCSGGPPNM